ncbi:hypothetical protein CTEN210_09346 [Chaetoceros tenuissimus]|uniref:peptidylprolyl isomerase n=1 Tax=Chaetoceros tenuissimus TaxID=426638 RepID=A0AAD3CXQ5_9STRA|nr:hypothetical protein CTEN210_09346 [Chaetoceros tenuissimus]
MKLNSIVIASAISGVSAFVAPTNVAFSQTTQLNAEANQESSRRSAINQFVASGLATLALTTSPVTSQALVEGNPPPSKSPKKALGEEYLQGTSALADMDANAPLPQSAYKKLPSGVIYADLRQGNGEEVVESSRVNIQWVLRKSNGYFVDSSEVQDGVPFIFTVGKKDGADSAIEGLDEAIRGMKAGGTRRVLIPPRLAYVKGLEDNLPGPMPAGYGPRQQMRRIQKIRADVPGEYIYLEVQLTRVR